LHFTNGVKYEICVAGYGNYLSMLSTSTRPGLTARHQTKYINTTNMCIELFYKTTALSTVAVIAISEDKFEKILVSSDGTLSQTWTRLSASLPSGLYQIAIEGRRSQLGVSSLNVDDVVIRPCRKFGTYIRCLLKIVQPIRLI
jgi:MAM domain, meprin/A5/mu